MKSMKKKLDDKQIKELQDMFERSGALDYGKKLIKQHAESASTTLANIAFTDETARQGIQTLINKIADFKE